jgi:cyanophycinase-like exopeptidase
MVSHGRVALVGSGEYLPVMADFERELLSAGGSENYVQIPTAAGQENSGRLDYWRELGAAQAERIGAKQIFLPIFAREDAMRQDLADQINGAGLIYLSGGDPHYLAATLHGTPVLEAIISNWGSGTSIAGCSAGAMALGPDIPHFRKMKENGELGFGLVPNIRTIPHYNKFFRWIPEIAAQKFIQALEDICIVGIDENTAIHSQDLIEWTVVGEGKCHVLKANNPEVLSAGQSKKIIA